MSIRYETVRILRKFFSSLTHTHGNVTTDGKMNVANAILTTNNNKEIVASATITKDKISDFPQTIPPSSHTHPKSEITNFNHNHTVSEITDFPNEMTPSSHNHGAVSDTGTLNSDTSNVGKVVVTDTLNNLKTVNQLPFSKLNITKSNITGLGIPATDTNTTYNAGTGLNLTGTTFSVHDAPSTEVTHTIDSNSDFKYINGGTPAPVGTIYTQKAINELINNRLGELFEITTLTLSNTQMSTGRFTTASWLRFIKIGKIILVDYFLKNNEPNNLPKDTTLHVCHIPPAFSPDPEKYNERIFSNWVTSGSRGQIRMTLPEAGSPNYKLKLYIFDNPISTQAIVGQLIYLGE